MRFGDPVWLWGLLVLLPALGWLILVVRLRRARLRRFAAGRPERFDRTVDVHRRWAGHLLWLLFLGCACLALARPQWGGGVESIQRTGIDVFLLVDTSRSMAVEDAAPNRLRQAIHAAGNLLRKIPGNRVGLITFAGEPTVQCPLTVDHAAVRLFLEPLGVDAVPVAGTSMAASLRLAVERLEAAPDPDRGRAVVLFSDGEDHEGGLPEAGSRLAEAGVPVFAVGVGSTRGGPIPLRNAAGALEGYKKDGDGRIVTSRMDEGPLRELTQRTGGRYFAATPAENEIDELARELTSMEGRAFETPWTRSFRERYQWPLAVAFAALWVQGTLGERRRRARKGETDA